MVKYTSNLKLGIKFKKITEREKMDKVYKTKQRELILKYLKDNSHRCLSAEEIINGISTPEKRASKATVYRCLELFTNDGSASKFTGSHGDSAVYRYNGGHGDHFHLKCTVCESMSCIDCGFISRMQQHFYDSHGFTVSKTQTVIYGLCRYCSAKERTAK